MLPRTTMSIVLAANLNQSGPILIIANTIQLCTQNTMTWNIDWLMPARRQSIK